MTDFGSGSKIFKNNDRKVADIAKIAGMTKKKTAILVIRLSGVGELLIRYIFEESV